MELEPIHRPPRAAAHRPTILGAIDAGSNAVRAAVAVATPGSPPRLLNRLRLPVRLGRQVFTGAHLDPVAAAQALDAFDRFRAMFDQYGATRVRAVGTSALREARDRQLLIDAIRARTGLRLEPIDGAEEARLVRTAVLEAFPRERPPELIADLGGGSLEISTLYRGARVTSAALPLGTVRLVETLGLDGPLSPGAIDFVRGHALRALRGALPAPERPVEIALCGGNARTLARLWGGASAHGLATLDVGALAAELPVLAGLTVEQRMVAYDVGRDRAEVMAIAAVVIATLAGWLGAGRLIVPGVGVLDGLLSELAVLGEPCRRDR